MTDRFAFGSSMFQSEKKSKKKMLQYETYAPEGPLFRLLIPDYDLDLGKESQILQVSHLFIKLYLSLRPMKFTLALSSQFGDII